MMGADCLRRPVFNVMRFVAVSRTGTSKSRSIEAGSGQEEREELEEIEKRGPLEEDEDEELALLEEDEDEELVLVPVPGRGAVADFSLGGWGCNAEFGGPFSMWATKNTPNILPNDSSKDSLKHLEAETNCWTWWHSKSMWRSYKPRISTTMGHDDVIAILLALHSPEVALLGVSTVHGNASAHNTAHNAARCLEAFGAPAHVRVHPGATKPLLKPAKHDPEIHGADGLGGVLGLPAADSPSVQARFAVHPATHEPIRALDGIASAVRSALGRSEKVTIVSCGPLTNIALWVSVYPELIPGVEAFVFMGGGVGLGNRSAVAEYNILCDPEAAQIVLDVPVRKVMVPINVTHTAIATPAVLTRLLPPAAAKSGVRHTLATLIGFFAGAYDSTFGFSAGPPLHDALTIAYVARPELFALKRFRVDVELGGKHTSGETVVDVWDYGQCDESWGVGGKNCFVAQSVDVDAFFEMFFECVERCETASARGIELPH
ncbi:hypothetical protein FIBSPDRAFT_932436 [Athelia psychrophila]|uniref:Inosine/uridine-preferring nucleoside hydrolase domain-containing protein n=1 Tax=Athelia psychrophila TaxID=1759441 RepID=A0A166IUE0_9AGAM|nr:hypothetical protein FIBSPDRAFT_932436 [Fibularhizoctonia sp. CBS 109695]